jgi:hypothetical protein
MQGHRRYSKFFMVAAAVVGVLACADGLAPSRSPDVLPNAGGDSPKEPTPSAASDTTIPANRLRGMVVAASPDSTATWRPLGSVRLEAAQRDSRTGEMILLATAASNDAGRFVFDKLDVPTGLVFLRAVPAAGTGYRNSRWLAAYEFVGPWLTISQGKSGDAPTDVWKLGPYVVLEPSSRPQSEYAPVLFIGRVFGGGPTPVAGARVVIDSAARASGSTVPIPRGTVASGRTDGNGFALIALPGPGLYVVRVAPPADWRGTNFSPTASFTTAAGTETTRVILSEFEIPR